MATATFAEPPATCPLLPVSCYLLPVRYIDPERLKKSRPTWGTGLFALQHEEAV